VFFWGARAALLADSESESPSQKKRKKEKKTNRTELESITTAPFFSSEYCQSGFFWGGGVSCFAFASFFLEG
jgi:hypothetical protein